MLNGTRFRVGTGTFLRLPKYLYSSNRQLQVLRIRRSELLTLRHGSGAGTRPRTLLLFTFHPGCGGGGQGWSGGLNCADLSSKLLCSIWTAKHRAWHRWPLHLA